MRTPAVYSNNLKNHIITSQMLLDCLYSSNKRAKNWRDKERDYRYKFRHNRYYYDKYNLEEKAREKKEHYYDQKDMMLSVLKPVCIHKEMIERKERVRVYDYEDEYCELEARGEFVHTGSYWDNEIKEYVCFGDILIDADPIYHYYLFYDIGGNHTFHTPINKEDVCLYNLEVKDIDRLNTTGQDISELVSAQFVKKVIDLIKTEDFELVENI